jgi:hypothetical protein
MAFWILLLLMCFANFRITRLIVKDDFPPILWIRNKIIDFKPDHIIKDRDDDQQYYVHWWGGSLITCGWCAGGWTSGAMVLVIWFLHGMPLPILIWFAIWGVSSILTDKLDD